MTTFARSNFHGLGAVTSGGVSISKLCLSPVPYVVIRSIPLVSLASNDRVASLVFFADALPIFDIVFGTYYRPRTEEFPTTGLCPDLPAPLSFLSAQFAPLAAVGRMLATKTRHCEAVTEEGADICRKRLAQISNRKAYE